MDAVVEASSVGHAYGDLTALADVDLAVREGEIFGLIGPNGAGKTTLVRAMSGALTPDEGTVRVFGQTPGTAAGDRVGLLPQSFGPPGRLTGEEIISYYRGLYDDGRAIDDVLGDVGMAGDSDQWFERLSGGQRRRICVGSALVNDPDLLLLDEPTTGIDPRGRRRIRELLAELRADGRTILLTTHDMGEAEALADRVALLADGHVVTVGKPSTLIEEHGPDTRLAIEPNGSVEDAVLEELDWVVERRGDRIVVPGVTPEDVSSVAERLDALNVEYTRFVWEQPTLEDVYFALLPEEDAQ